MNVIEQRQYEMLVRVRNFGTTYGHLFPASSVAGETFAAVDAAIKELDAQELAHLAASVSARAQRKDTARQALHGSPSGDRPDGARASPGRFGPGRSSSRCRLRQPTRRC